MILKKSFTLFFTLVLIFVFSLFLINIFEVKSLSSINIVNQYKYLQAKNHLKFLEQYTYSIKDLNFVDKIEIENEKYEIKALIEKKKTNNFEVQLSVKAIDFDVRVYKKLEIIK